MASDAIAAILVSLFGLTSTIYSVLYITKERFPNSKDFYVLRDGLPFSVSVNYWISKLFLLLSGVLFTVIGIYLFIRDI